MFESLPINDPLSEIFPIEPRNIEFDIIESLPADEAFENKDCLISEFDIIESLSINELSENKECLPLDVFNEIKERRRGSSSGLEGVKEAICEFIDAFFDNKKPRQELLIDPSADVIDCNRVSSTGPLESTKESSKCWICFFRSSIVFLRANQSVTRLC